MERGATRVSSMYGNVPSRSAHSVQYNGYNLIGVTTAERGDGSYDSTGLFLYIRRLLKPGTIHCTQQGLDAQLYGRYRSAAKPVSTLKSFSVDFLPLSRPPNFISIMLYNIHGSKTLGLPNDSPLCLVVQYI
jgi:hypothetical protein